MTFSLANTRLFKLYKGQGDVLSNVTNRSGELVLDGERQRLQTMPFLTRACRQFSVLDPRSLSTEFGSTKNFINGEKRLCERLCGQKYVLRT